MPVSLYEVMKGSVLLFEGKTYRVQSIADFILLEGRKEWIGGSLINGEPLSVEWLMRLNFTEGQQKGWWSNGKIVVGLIANGSFLIDKMERRFEYVHELQLIHFAITGEHIKVPKLKP